MQTRQEALITEALGTPNPRSHIAAKVRTALHHLKTSNARWARELLGFSRDDLPAAPAEGLTLTWAKPLHLVNLTDLITLAASLSPGNLKWVTAQEMKAIRGEASATLRNSAEQRQNRADKLSREALRDRIEADIAALIAVTVGQARIDHLNDALTHVQLAHPRRPHES